MDIYFRDLHNDKIKPYESCGLASVVVSLTQKFLIIDTTSRSFIPPQVCKVTAKLRQIYRCEICIILKDAKNDLNRFRTRLVTYLKYKYDERHTRTSGFSTTSAKHYKDKAFPYVECLYATIKDAAQYINCLPI